MIVINRIIMVIGILGAIAAAEGLNRFGGLVSTFGGEDTPYYMAMLIIAAVGAVVLLVAVFNKSHSVLKWVMVVLLLGSSGLMLNAPSVPVSNQIIIGLFNAALATGFIKTNK